MGIRYLIILFVESLGYWIKLLIFNVELLIHALL